MYDAQTYNFDEFFQIFILQDCTKTTSPPHVCESHLVRGYKEEQCWLPAVHLPIDPDPAHTGRQVKNKFIWPATFSKIHKLHFWCFEEEKSKKPIYATCTTTFLNPQISYF